MDSNEAPMLRSPHYLYAKMVLFVFLVFALYVDYNALSEVDKHDLKVYAFQGCVGSTSVFVLDFVLEVKQPGLERMRLGRWRWCWVDGQGFWYLPIVPIFGVVFDAYVIFRAFIMDDPVESNISHFLIGIGLTQFGIMAEEIAHWTLKYYVPKYMKPLVVGMEQLQMTP